MGENESDCWFVPGTKLWDVEKAESRGKKLRRTRFSAWKTIQCKLLGIVSRFALSFQMLSFKFFHKVLML